MKTINIMSRACLLILCLPLSACLFQVGSHYDIQHTIAGDGSVDMTLAPFEDIDGLKLSAAAYLGGGGEVAVECESGGAFVPLYTVDSPPAFVTVDGADVPDFSGLVAANCDFNPVDDHYALELAIRVGDTYLPIFTRDNLMCMAFKIQTGGKDFYGMMTGCIADDGRATTSPLGLNTAVDEINVLRIEVSQEYVDSIGA